MARQLRLEHPGAVWHITSRGNERKNIFRSDADRERFLGLLTETVEVFGWTPHVYVLMSNRFVIETPECNLSRGMHWLNGCYAQKFNKRHRRVGHLFQGRFKGILVEKESHLLELVRYGCSIRYGQRWSKDRRIGNGAATAPPRESKAHSHF